MKTHCTLLFLLTVLCNPLLRAQDVDFDAVGVIDKARLDKRTLSIGDITFRLGPNLLVHEAGSLVDSARLVPGRKVGFRFGQNRSRRLYEIWLLPSSYDIDRFYARETE